MSDVAPSPRSERLVRVVNFWETLTPATVAKLSTVYADDAFFRDPFNEVRGLTAIEHIFADMFHRLHEPRFTITETIEQGDSVFLIWNFDFRIKALAPTRQRRIHGTSHLQFAADGRVLYHRDYWDAAGELYEQFPVVGGLMKWLKSRAK